MKGEGMRSKVCLRRLFLVAMPVLLAIMLSGCASGRVVRGILSGRGLSKADPEVVRETKEGEGHESAGVDPIAPEKNRFCPLLAPVSYGGVIDTLLVSEGYYCVYNGERYGFVSEDGTEITPCIYEQAAPFHEGLACVCQNGKYGFIDGNGETVIPFIYDRAASFSEGLAYFARGDDYGFMDRTGEPVFYLECDSVSSFQEGFAFFSVDGRYGYIDQTGQIVIEPVYEDAGYFEGGLARVMQGGRYGVIDREGNQVIAPEYDTIYADGSFIIVLSGGKYGCFDRTGRKLCEAAYDNISVDGDFLCLQKDEGCGLADKNGTMLLEPVYQWMSVVREQEFVIVRQEESSGILNLDGEIVLPFQYQWLSYQNGMLVCSDQEGRYGSLDASGLTEVLPCIYDSVRWFPDQRAMVRLDGKYGVADREGNLLALVEYDQVGIFDGGALWLRQGSEARLLDSGGEVITEEYYDRVIQRGENCYQVIRNGKEGLIDGQGEEILPLGYDYISETRVYGSSQVLLASRYGGENDPGANMIIKTEASGQGDVSQAVLSNELTPRSGLYLEFVKSGSVGIESGYAAEIEELNGYRRVYKLYDLEHTGSPILYFYAAPFVNVGFPLSHSGFFTVRDGRLEELFTGYECGGSMGGDQVCLWYDTENGRVMPGSCGNYGGFGGYAYRGDIYDYRAGEAWSVASFSRVNQLASNYSSEELKEHAELFYDEEGLPCTEETVMEADRVWEYEVDRVQTTRERYEEAAGRYCQMQSFSGFELR